LHEAYGKETITAIRNSFIGIEVANVEDLKIHKDQMELHFNVMS